MTADKQITLTRRDALKVSFLGGALVIAAPRRALAGMNDAQQARAALGPFVKIFTDNRIVISAPIPDMGTGVETALPMLVAEELDADWRTVEIERFPAAVLVDEESGADRAIVSKYAHQGTGGSASVRMSWTVLRDCGAYARDLIVKAAAINLGVPATALTTENANITNSTNGQTYRYGQFVETAAALANDSPIGLVRENIDGVRYRADVPPVSEGGPPRKPVGDFRNCWQTAATEKPPRNYQGRRNIRNRYRSAEPEIRNNRPLPLFQRRRKQFRRQPRTFSQRRCRRHRGSAGSAPRVDPTNDECGRRRNCNISLGGAKGARRL